MVSGRGGEATSNNFSHTVERPERTIYLSSLRNDDQENFFGAVVGQEPVEESLFVQLLDPGSPGPTRLEVALQGVTAGTHRVKITLNGVSVGEVTFQGQAFTPAQAQPVAAVRPNQPSRWRRSRYGADFVLISHPDFITALEPLRVQRQNQGLQVAVVNVEDIFDEFSYGHKTPYAVRNFLRYAVRQWAPAPRFVLFVGDASLDPKNYLGFGDYDFVPTKLIDTALMEAASDDWLGDFYGDGLAELAVGRLPVRTAEEAERLVTKLVSYDQTAAAAGVLLVADLSDGFDFEATNAQLVELLPADVPVEEIHRGQMGTDAAKDQLLEGLNRGPALVNYIGHGSVDLSSPTWPNSPRPISRSSCGMGVPSAGCTSNADPTTFVASTSRCYHSTARLGSVPPSSKTSWPKPPTLASRSVSTWKSLTPPVVCTNG